MSLDSVHGSLVPMVSIVSVSVLGFSTGILVPWVSVSVLGLCTRFCGSLVPWVSMVSMMSVSVLGCSTGSLVPWVSVVPMASVSILGFCGSLVSTVSMVSTVSVVSAVSMVSASVHGCSTWFLGALGVHGVCQCPWNLYTVPKCLWCLPASLVAVHGSLVPWVSVVSMVSFVSVNVLGLRTWFLVARSVHGVCQCSWLLYKFLGALGVCGIHGVCLGCLWCLVVSLDDLFVPWVSVV